ncbi:hypothetical protein B0G71_2406 [Paraburkholderia sp. BL27I4N3]|nr:hypothetical protein B0G71_2406 [Paraburkholderia sp. BL27I4N3]
MLSPLPRRSDWASSLLIHPVVSAFPDRVAGSACASSFSRFARRSLALRPAHSRCHLFVTRITRGFSHFVTSMTAPVASGWSGCRAGLAPAGKRRLFTAHTRKRPCPAACPACTCVLNDLVAPGSTSSDEASATARSADAQFAQLLDFDFSALRFGRISLRKFKRKHSPIRTARRCDGRPRGIIRITCRGVDPAQM